VRDLEPPEPVVRYEYATPGGLIHPDIKKLGRFERTGHRITGKRTGNASSGGSGWELVHACIDDASRVALSQILPDEKKQSAAAFLKAAVAYYASIETPQLGRDSSRAMMSCVAPVSPRRGKTRLML
jgi:hypothetical protein